MMKRLTTLWKLSAALMLMSLLLVSSCNRKSSESDDTNPNVLYVAAASDLTPPFEEIGREFERATGIRVIYNFGSTGMLAKQIENGAPVDVFAAANVQFIDELDRKGLIISDTKALYARGRITVWMKSDSPLKIERLEDLARPEVQRIAIANPEHAPYGVAAREALQSVHIWDAVAPKCVFGENVSQTLQYAQSGNVDVSIVALSLSRQSNGRWILIPEELHKPLDQAMAALKRTTRGQQARAFIAFINGEKGRPVMRKYGFNLPSEPIANK